ncbi:MAG: hypothetical protein WCJ37_19990 [Syntrophus sp. (in: bacteria)]
MIQDEIPAITIGLAALFDFCCLVVARSLIAFAIIFGGVVGFSAATKAVKYVRERITQNDTIKPAGNSENKNHNG